MTMRFGILGTGRITRRLVAEIQSCPETEVVCIASRQQERASWYAQQFGIAVGVTGYPTLLQRPDVDAVYIALPPALHLQWSLAAVEHGKHLLCEKPLVIDSGQAQQLAKACGETSRRWLDATGWLHHPRTASFTEAVNNGKLGHLRHISTAVSFFEPFQSQDHRLQADLGGGCLLDLAWYAVGLPIWLAGPPAAVYATAIYRQDVPYRVSGLLWFDDEVQATFSCGYDTSTRKWCEVAGTAGSVVCDDFTRTWPGKPQRYWIHDRTGTATVIEENGNQEQRMLRTFADLDHDLSRLQQQALCTQRTLDAISKSITMNARIDIPPLQRESACN